MVENGYYLHTGNGGSCAEGRVYVSGQRPKAGNLNTEFCGGHMKRFSRSEDGYVIVLSLIVLPIFIGLALLVIDIGRGNNAHADLSAAADALALAGARELDGGVDAIDRAKDAMEELTNTVNMLEATGPNVHVNLQYVDGPGDGFTVHFLSDIPENDHTPITAAWIAANTATSGPDAEYVYVRAQSVNLHTFFLNPANLLAESVPVAAVAVAKSLKAACWVTPIYICNPFESDYAGGDLQSNFSQGNLHGRLIKLHPKGSDTERPGNFGFLQVSGNSSADAIRDIFAGGQNPTCYDADKVTTKPGAATSIRQGINVRFDIYEGPFSNAASTYAPAVNVRKGYLPAPTGPSNACNWELTTDLTQAMPFPENDTMSDPTSGALGSKIGSGDWDIDTYWAINHPSNPGLKPTSANSSFPSASYPGVSQPSRYDVYRYEIDNGLITDTSPGGEVGTPICSASKTNPAPPTDDPDRRVVFAAIIDCLANAGQGVTTFPVNSYASVFMASPMESNGPDDATLDVEIIDISGWGGNGTLDTFVREEAVLVR